MSIDYVLEAWLIEQDAPGAAPGGPPQAPDPGAAGPTSGMQAPGQDQPPGGEDPNQQPPQDDGQGGQEDVTQDPEHPDMGDDVDDKSDDFQTWKKSYFEESIKGNANVLLDLLNQVRDRDLKPDDRRFVENNLQIQFLRLLSNIQAASKEIRRDVNDQLDQNNPATSLVQFLSNALEKQTLLTENFIKINGYGGMKGDVHRKYLAALMGAVQVGSGANQEDLVLEDNDYSVKISTRMNSTFGMIDIGRWALHEGDTQRYLEEPEQKKLQQGSPEEREVLRRRVIMESIANHFKERAFLITVMGEDGTIYNMGWDLETCIRAAYLEGKLVVRTKLSKESEAMIDSKGTIVPFMDIDIKYAKETGELDEDGTPQKREVPFMQRENGMLYLVCGLDVLKDATQNLQGLVVKPIPYTGNPSDILRISRCTYNVSELLSRTCT
jgi:hypothetical protein